ncbi:hypothetical protein [Amycolatopsis tucumanensis]|uniref:Uncharacterized protein n=1 Tax=Amycolatopsis tucumanensis TaxID=401106 RepID=A0ABP7JWA0_9PSEU|nr:hypothetical protein [Amycolatopsis tucumanensis]MCF6426443.1 hypothetical protein [Amycolatopsis tucumanensis]
MSSASTVATTNDHSTPVPAPAAATAGAAAMAADGAAAEIDCANTCSGPRLRRSSPDIGDSRRNGGSTRGGTDIRHFLLCGR